MELVYENMNERNVWHRTTPIVNQKLEEGRCLAAYSVGDWYLQTSFQRFLERLKAIVGDTGCVYTPVPCQSEGVLHQTLLQFVKFDSFPHARELSVQAMQCVADILKQKNLALQIQYKGLVWTPTGLALAGYSDDEESVLQIRNEIETTLLCKQLPCDIPYKNDILHATVMRWIKRPEPTMLIRLEDEVKRWSECTFGELRVRRWIVGNGSWRMKEEEREDHFQIPVHQHICHRGNLTPGRKDLENNFGVLNERSNQKYRVEVDIWYHNHNLWLGHDRPEYKVTLEWLASCPRRLIHAKDGKTFAYLLQEAGKKALDLHIFFHTEEEYVLTNKGFIICYPGVPLLEGSLCMMPERASYTAEEKEVCFTICSDTKT